MLTIHTNGAKALLALLVDVHEGRPADQPRLNAVLRANEFFFSNYAGWTGNPAGLVRAVTEFGNPSSFAEGSLEARMAEGFLQAAGDPGTLWGKLEWLDQVDATAVGGRVSAYLPENTPLDASIYITIDNFNNAFFNDSGMGVSLLKGTTDRRTFESAVSHELHHIGFRHWANPRLAAAGSGTPSSVAAAHVLNLLMEGMANGYLTPEYVFAAAQPDPEDRYQQKLVRLKVNEADLFRQAEEVLRLCFRSDAGYEACNEAYMGVAMDWKECLLPAGHYLGARMVQTIDRHAGRESVIACVREPAEFLPLYTRCANEESGFVFDSGIVNQVVSLLK